MKSDTVKTLAGLGVIALIVGATFLYGNSQRQAQLTQNKTESPSPSVSASAAPKASASPSATPKPSPTSSPKAVVQGPSDGQTPQPAAAPTPAAGPMPAAGPETLPAVGFAAMLVAFGLWRRSRRLAAERLPVRR
jgi:hypothetical protein